MVKMENREVKVLHALIGKAGTTTEPIPCWEFSGRMLVLEDLVKPIRKAEDELPRVKEYNAKRSRLMNEYKTFVREYQDPFGGMVAQYDKKDEKSDGIFIVESKKLYAEYEADLLADIERRKKVEELLGIVVDVDIEPIKFEWLFDADGKSLLQGNEITFLRKHGLVVRGDEKSEEPENNEKVTKIRKK